MALPGSLAETALPLVPVSKSADSGACGLGEIEREVELLGDWLALGLIDWLAEGERLALGEMEAEGESDDDGLTTIAGPG